jgi:hypothetical protein
MIEEASVGVEEHLEKPMDLKRNHNISVNTTSVNRKRDFRGDSSSVEILQMPVFKNDSSLVNIIIKLLENTF